VAQGKGLSRFVYDQDSFGRSRRIHYLFLMSQLADQCLP
jgi:hypothetical protein